MKICEGNEFPESAECLRLALFIISNLVGAPLNNHDTEARKGSPCSDVAELWDVFRSNEGLMMLIDRITKENTEHDVNDVFIREAACEALCGLARCESVRQVLSKLPIIAGDGLLVTCKKIYQAPIRPEQELFYKQAKNLVEKVIKVTIRDEDAKEFSQERIKRSTIIANTRYYFRDVEMLQLTCNYLNKLGLSSSATHLAAEARLNASRTLDFTPSAHRMLTDTPTRNHDFTQPRPLVHKRIKGREFEPKPVDRGQMIDRAKDLEKSITRVVNTPSTPALPVTPSTSRGSSHYRRQNTHVRCTDGKHENSDPLNDILSTYFKEKHSHCKHPVAICPPFSLFKEHKCSAIYTSRPRLDFSGRYIHRGIYPNYGNSRLHTADLYQIYSRFAQYKIFQNKEGAFTSCAFSSDDEHILLGTFEGELLWYNIVTEEVECRQQCHNGVPLNEIDGSLLLTATNAGLSTSILWNLGETPKLTARYNNASHACFSNTSTQYVMTTSYETATVHDLETESIVATFKETKNANLYQHNVATFDYKDTMVMNDGILYDFRASSSPIHKFDKLNSENGGVFHPDCLSVIVNTEVYDLRNYKLLHHVPALDNARITFNSRGNVLYAVSRDNTEDDEFTTVYKPLLVTLDTKNYEIIASNTLKRHLFDFAIDHSEGRVATVERSDAYVPENNMCRLFDIGKVRDDEEPRTFHDDDDQGDSSNSDDDDESRTSSNSDDDSDNLHDLFFPPSSGSERSGLSDDIGSFGESSDDGSDIGSDDDSVGSMDSELAEILDGAYGGEELYDDDDGEGEDESESEEDEEGEGEDEEDEEEEEDLPGTSSIVLNPRLRKERREQARRQEEEKQGGERSDSD
ncbi:hypothetical protein QR680_002396 [Steinernema hermaphroditum]|uniref:LisH domain-containing protein n=1 Tax=Steinernema hermaphroditum TaxID=289476 RepID=A0AA39H2I8_9BILA|nr:hypothetical protein QR680_002396 [Steinernema hermaphroditum]